MEKIKLVCFDVDGTLTDNSWVMLTEGLGCSSQKHIDIFRQCQKGEITFTEGGRLLGDMYQKSGKASKEFISGLLSKAKIKDEAADLISYLKEKGCLIYLISGAIDIHVESVAKKLEVDGFYSNSSLDFNDKGSFLKINYRSNQGEIKVEQLQELVKKLGIDLEEVAFIGDDYNDVEIFKVIKYGIAVHSSSEELDKVAWKKVDSLREIKGIL